jgi:hypothetical protein
VLKRLTAIALTLCFCLLAYGGLAFYQLKSGGIETTVACAIGDSGLRVPQAACAWWLPYSMKKALPEQRTQTFHQMLSAFTMEERPSQKSKQALAATELALNHGVNINSLNPASQLTGLHGAVLATNPDLIRFLVSRGAKINAEDPRTGQTPIEMARFVQENNPGSDIDEIIRLLEKNSTKPSA